MTTPLALALLRLVSDPLAEELSEHPGAVSLRWLRAASISRDRRCVVQGCGRLLSRLERQRCGHCSLKLAENGRRSVDMAGGSWRPAP